MKIRYDKEARAAYIQLMPDLPEGEHVDYSHETPDINVLIDIKDGNVYGIDLLNIESVEIT